jgi:nucleotide-binding universal stress UspA family protein
MKILFATDASDAAAEAAKFLAMLPLPQRTEIRAVTVGDRLSEWMIDWPQSTEGEWGSRILGQAVEALTRDGVTVSTEVRRGEPSREIAHAAEEFKAELIVVGSHGLTGLAAFLLGGVARNVAHHARVPVLVARTVAHGLQRVVLAVDQSENAATAADFAGSFPLPAEIELLVTHVVQPFQRKQWVGTADPEEVERLEQHVRHDRRTAAVQLVGRLAVSLKERVAHVSPMVREGDPTHEILKLAAEQQADLIIAGARGVSVLERLLVGSVADRLLNHAPCSVLLVR